MNVTVDKISTNTPQDNCNVMQCCISRASLESLECASVVLSVSTQSFARSVHSAKISVFSSQLQRPRGLRRASAATRLLGLRVRIQPDAWVSVPCECCVFLRRDLSDRPISRPEIPTECVCVCVCVIRCNNNTLHL